MSDIRQRIANELIKNSFGLTVRELAEELDAKPQQISGTIQHMVTAECVEKGEKLEIEGQVYLITPEGREKYGTKKAAEESALTQTEKTVVETIEAAPIVEESVLEQNETEPKTLVFEDTHFTPAPYESELAEIDKKHLSEMEIGTFEVFQLTDNLASSFIKLMQSKQAKPIQNIDYKIATLESLAEIYNPKISATLREIAADLRG